TGRLQPAIEITADPFSDQRLEVSPPPDWRSMDRKTFIEHVQRAGIVGMGGAAFPTHVKLALPEGKTCRRLVVNGCECEPYLTCDHRVMVERPDAVVRGAMMLAEKLEAAEGISIGVELNKHDAIEALRAAVPPGARIDVTPLKVKYPQGAEKMLINALFGLEVPAGKLPIDVGIVVNNVATTAAIADYFETGTPLIERLLTVAGPGVRRPANLVVPIGTPVAEVLEHCGALDADSAQVIMGGPMMGAPLASLDVPVLKGTSGLLAFPITDDVSFAQEYQCVKCGRCLDACANFLNPSRLARLSRVGRFEEMERYFVYDCMECGACSFACPSNIPIVQLIRVAKSELRKAKAASK
ncbi:MAG: electron transport complex subunit RsxC, partial [Candidatus Eisenbacteria bacterium]|nr:electron transport complex subunit RsxC [Candidatus Eisenbacteria bacterium]